MKISKHQGMPTAYYDENCERRVVCPEWWFSVEFIQRLKHRAKEHDLSVSRYFETIIKNFFVLEDPNIRVFVKKSSTKRQKTPKMTIHPVVIEEIKKYSTNTNARPSAYIELLFYTYWGKYKEDIELKKILLA